MGTAEKKRAENWLFAATFANTFAGSFAMQAIDQIFLEHFAGDFAAHGRMMSWIGSGSSALSFLCKPMLGSLIDVYGRKWLLLFSPSLQVLLKGLMVCVPRQFWVPLIVLQYFVGFLTFEGFMFARDASFADMHQGDPKALGQALARLQIIWPLSSVISPLIGGQVTAKSHRSSSARISWALNSMFRVFCMVKMDAFIW